MQIPPAKKLMVTGADPNGAGLSSPRESREADKSTNHAGYSAKHDATLEGVLLLCSSSQPETTNKMEDRPLWESRPQI